jgi:hypothetical protein
MVGRQKGWSTYRGKFAGLKSNGMARWKTLLERDYLYLLEYDSSVLAYEKPNLDVHYTRAGEAHVLIPDLLVRRRYSLQLVKLLSDRELTEGREPSAPAARLNRVEGYDLIVLTDAEVRRQPLLDNVKVLWRYARVRVDAAQCQLLCLDFFRGRDGVPLGELITFFTQRGLTEAEIFALIFRGILSVDMMKPLTRRSPVGHSGALTSLKKGA